MARKRKRPQSAEELPPPRFTISLKEWMGEQSPSLDPLWENHPKVKQIRAESEAKGRAEGRAEGEVKGRLEGELEASRKLVVSVVAARFPTVAEAARKRGAQINSLGALDLLIQQVSIAPDEKILRCLLLLPVA